VYVLTLLLSLFFRGGSGISLQGQYQINILIKPSTYLIKPHKGVSGGPSWASVEGFVLSIIIICSIFIIPQAYIICFVLSPDFVTMVASARKRRACAVYYYHGLKKAILFFFSKRIPVPTDAGCTTHHPVIIKHHHGSATHGIVKPHHFESLNFDVQIPGQMK
jgi:hypothetical protein